MNDGETSTRRHGVGRQDVIKEKGHRRLFRLVKQSRGQKVVQPTAQYDAGPSINESELTFWAIVGYRDKEQTTQLICFC